MFIHVLVRGFKWSSYHGEVKQVLHQRWIWGICCMQEMNHTSEESTLALKSTLDVTNSPKMDISGPHKKDWCFLFSLLAELVRNHRTDTRGCNYKHLRCRQSQCNRTLSMSNVRLINGVGNNVEFRQKFMTTKTIQYSTWHSIPEDETTLSLSITTNHFNQVRLTFHNPRQLTPRTVAYCITRWPSNVSPSSSKARGDGENIWLLRRINSLIIGTCKLICADMKGW